MHLECSCERKNIVSFISCSLDYIRLDMATTVAILSDTHIPSKLVGLPPRTLPQIIFPYLEKADLILHAGDIVEGRVLDELAFYAPVKAVRGDHDSDASVANLPEVIEIKLEGVSIVMLHNSGRNRAGRRKRLCRRFPEARVIIFGHSHRPGIEDQDGLMLVNPGSIGGMQSSFGLLCIDDGEVFCEIVDPATGEHKSGDEYPPISTEPRRNRKSNFDSATKRMLRERAGHRCQHCSSPSSLEFDHIVPVSEDGDGSLNNGQVLCHLCHLKKTGKDRRRKEIHELLEDDPNHPISSRHIDFIFGLLARHGVDPPICEKDLRSLSARESANKLSAMGADYLALDLLRGYYSSSHDKYYGISSDPLNMRRGSHPVQTRPQISRVHEIIGTLLKLIRREQG